MLLLLPEGYFLMFLDTIPGRRYKYKVFFFKYTFYNWLFVVLLSALNFFFTCFISSDVILIDNSAMFLGVSHNLPTIGIA